MSLSICEKTTTLIVLEPVQHFIESTDIYTTDTIEGTDIDIDTTADI
jgi:hypothetical protein